MNQYGRFAEQSWQMLAPARYAALEDPNHFFSTLGQEAQTRVVWLAEQMQGPDPTGETYWEKVGRLNAIRMQAEEIVRAEMLTPEPETLEEDDENAGFDPQTFSAGSPNRTRRPGVPVASSAAFAARIAVSDAVPKDECGSVWPEA